MTTTNIIKWNDTANQLTAYCDDDPAETELGPAKWDDANNVLEIHCDGNEYQVKWNDDDNRLEARSVDCSCREYLDGDICPCYDTGMTPRFFEHNFNSISDCGNDADVDCTRYNSPSVILEHHCLSTCTWYFTEVVGDTTYTVQYVQNGAIHGGASTTYALMKATTLSDAYVCYEKELSSTTCVENRTNEANLFSVGDCGTTSGILTVEGYGGTDTWNPL